MAAKKQVITLQEVCKKRKIDPRTARRKLRKAVAEKRPVPKHLNGQRWVWPVSKVKEILPYISD
jgi:hypothetical protein